VVIGAIVYKALAIWLMSKTELSKLILGGIIVVLTVAFPQGIGGFAGDVKAWWQARGAKPKEGAAPALEVEAAE
jgi:branched-chain amino acid transport system permease protein